MPLTEHAIAGLRAGVTRAKQYPYSLDMGIWIAPSTEDAEDVPCGTVGCYAFEICVAHGDDPRDLMDMGMAVGVPQSIRDAMDTNPIPLRAANILQMAPMDLEPLFNHSHWPRDLRERYTTYTVDQKPVFSLDQSNAKVGIVGLLEEAVERFIACGGKSELFRFYSRGVYEP